MNHRTALSIGIAALCPLMMAPVNVTGSLENFTRGTQGGQSAESWGASSSQGQTGSSTQSSTQGSTQSSTQSAGEAGDGPKQTPSDGSTDSNNSTQDPKGEPNLPDSNNSTQDPKGEPNDGNPSQDPKGEPNYDGGDSGSSSGGRSGSSGGSSSSGSSSSGGRGGSGDIPPPLSDDDGQYDPSNNDGDQQIPAGCENAESECAACVRRHEDAISFNRRYLHVAWSTAHDMIIKANRAIAIGDTASGMHATQGLAWQLGGKPQIVEALDDLRTHYKAKAKIYLDHIQDSVRLLGQCEADNFAIRDLYSRFGNMYVEFLRSRYETAD